MKLSHLATALLCLAASLTSGKAAETDAALKQIETLYRAEGAAVALPEFERLLGDYKQAGDARNAAIAQGLVGECHWRLGQFEESRRHLDSALALKRDLGDRLQVAKTLNVLGLLEWDLGNFETAIARFGEASAIGAEIGDTKVQGATLNNLSLVYDELGDYNTSLEQYHKVLEIYASAEFPRGVGDTLGNIGGVHLLLGHYSEAVNFYQRALEISEQLGSVPAMSQDHGNLGLAYAGMGRTDQALEHLEKALVLARQAGMRQEQGYWLRGIGNTQISAGRYDEGLEHHRAALAVYSEEGVDALLLDSQHDMGQLLLALGDPASAERHFTQALEIARALGVPRAITLNLLALGDLQYRHGRLEAAAALYDQALGRARDSGVRIFESTALIKLSAVHGDQRRFRLAREEAGQALKVAGDIQARALETEALYRLGEIDRGEGLYTESLARYRASAELAAEIGDPDLQWRIEYGRALSQVELGEREAGVASLQSAVTHIESVRSRLRENRFRAGYLQDKHQVYIDLVRLQLELGQTGAAFFTAERLRAWTFLEQSAPGDSRGWTDQQRTADTEMRERIRQLQRLLDEEEELPVPDRRQMAVATYSQELLLAETEYQAFLDDMEVRTRKGHRTSGTAADGDTRSLLREGEALIEYVVGQNNVMVFVLRPDWIRARTVPLSRVDLHSRLELLRDLLQQQGNKRWARPAARLAQALIAPVHGAGWLDGVEHLYLVPHGMLNYLPFTLLPLGPAQDQQPLVQRFSVSYLPSASVLTRPPVKSGVSPNILALAPARSRLRFAPEEARSIAELFAPHAKTLTGGNATESAFRAEAGKYQVLHLATHGYFNKLNPMLSGLELEADPAHDGLLEVHEILNLELTSDLVTLSACQTGLGSGFFNEIPAGDDFVGMTRAFLQAGSASVLATLWEVDDRSTVDLMQRFYTRLELPGAGGDKAVALAAAQRALLASERYRHPYFWAPFVLVGPMNHREGASG